MNNDLAGFLGLCLIIVDLAILIFVLTMLYRITRALERMSRHQLEMARDMKRIADASVPEEPR